MVDQSRQQVVGLPLAPAGTGMGAFASETWTLYRRHMMKLSRQPTIIAFSLIQPFIWLLLFGQLFTKIVTLPGAADDFGQVSYLQFFIPAVMLQTVLFGAGQSGVGIVGDMSSGYLDKLLTTPIHRMAILLGRVLGDLTRMMLQVVLVLLAGWAIGLFQDPQVSFVHGIGGILGALVIVMLFGLMLAGFNVFIALATKSTEATFIVSGFLTMPLLFVSSAQLPIALLPAWMQAVARVNPVTYAIDAVRAMLNGSASLDGRGTGEAFLIAIVYVGALAIVTTIVGTRRFKKLVA